MHAMKPKNGSSDRLLPCCSWMVRRAAEGAHACSVHTLAVFALNFGAYRRARVARGALHAAMVAHADSRTFCCGACMHATRSSNKKYIKKP
jgi:hypothetical protein